MACCQKSRPTDLSNCSCDFYSKYYPDSHQVISVWIRTSSVTDCLGTCRARDASVHMIPYPTINRTEQCD